MEENKTHIRIRIKCPKKPPALTDSCDGSKTSHNEGKSSSNGDIYEIANVEYPKSTTPTCQECGKTFPSDKALFGHLRCHPERSYRGIHPPPKATNMHHYSETHDSTTKLTPLAQKWPTRKRSRRLPVDIEDDVDEVTVAARILIQISKAEPVVIVNGFKTSEGERIIKKKKIEESELENVEPRACGRSYMCGVCLKSFSSDQALGKHKASHRKNDENTIPKEACGSECHEEATHYPSHSAHASNKITDHKKASFRVFDFDLNELPKPEGEEESNLQGV